MNSVSHHNLLPCALRCTCLSLFLVLTIGRGQPLPAQTLPYHGSATSSSTLWWITQLGLGPAGEFQISNSSNSNPALLGTTNGTGAGVQGISNSAKGYGVNGKSANGTGGKFYGGQFGVYAEGGAYGLYAFGATGQGVIGESAAAGGYGGYFDDNNGSGVYGSSTTYHGGVFWGAVGGVFACGTVDGSYGIDAASHGDANSVAVNGDSEPYGYGVRGSSFYGYGIYGSSYYGVAGGFNGNVTVTGTLSAGAKNFKIDHPLDPANKYLVHSCIESDQMINLYRGNIVLDANGQAIVTVPDWFEALNKNLSYQLTCVGGFAPVYVASELHKGAFAIAGGKPGLKVCWQITGERQDAYAKAHPLEVEQDKPQDKKGKFLHPKEWGVSESLGENYEVEQRIYARQHAQAK